MLKMKVIMLIAALIAVAYQAQAEDTISGNSGHKEGDTKNTIERQYTFAWNFTDSTDLKPRGGTSKGVPVTLDTQPSTAWLSLQEAGISNLERDRRAILAMVGDYKVSFDFIEVAGFTENYKPKAPYQSWATEKVYVIEDKGEFISLQHILVMQTVNKDGSKNPPMVTKHWRQDWQFQPKQVLVFKGHSTWLAEAVPAAQQKDAWSQTVYQVDDSPRYGGVTAWQHFGNFSSWNNQDAWRPLPRREYTVRNDYQVLLGCNRHIILPTGWVHEQQNNKVVLDKNLVLDKNMALNKDSKEVKPNATNPVIAREMGFNRYERIKGYDFAPGDTYLKNTEPFWREIRQQWTNLSQQKTPIRLRAPADKDGLYVVPFNYAQELNNGTQQTPEEMAKFAKKTVADYLAKENGAVNTRY